MQHAVAFYLLVIGYIYCYCQKLHICYSNALPALVLWPINGPSVMSPDRTNSSLIGSLTKECKASIASELFTWQYHLLVVNATIK